MRSAIGAIVFCALTLAGCGAAGTPSTFSSPAPQLFRWSAAAAQRSVTPQEAFAAGMTLDLCHPVTARSVTITWLAASADFGVVWVVADCRNDTDDPRPVRALFLVHNDAQTGPGCNHWTADNAGYITKPPADAIPAGIQAEIPPWLSLPADTYLEMPTGTSSHPLSNIISWLAVARVYITGRFEGRATAPAGATPVTVAGQPGWSVAEHGMATVTVPLADESSFFFSGVTTVSAAQSLAGETLPHLADELPLPTVTIVPTADPDFC